MYFSSLWIPHSLKLAIQRFKNFSAGMGALIHPCFGGTIVFAGCIYSPRQPCTQTCKPVFLKLCAARVFQVWLNPLRQKRREAPTQDRRHPSYTIPPEQAAPSLTHRDPQSRQKQYHNVLGTPSQVCLKLIDDRSNAQLLFSLSASVSNFPGGAC